MIDIGIGQIENDKTYNFKTQFDEENEIFSNLHSCKYYEMEDISKLHSNKFENFQSTHIIYVVLMDIGTIFWILLTLLFH